MICLHLLFKPSGADSHPLMVLCGVTSNRVHDFMAKATSEPQKAVFLYSVCSGVFRSPPADDERVWHSGHSSRQTARLL